ncbi:nuclear transport factor 2 family protein [Flagellimonas pacifica]|nr:nuclear transport factor 2 family protein [Allomuricauda parva]
MKKTMFFFSVLIILSACCKEAQNRLSENLVTGEDRNVLKNLKEVQWPKAYREQDTLLLDKILGDDFQMVDASGEWSTKTKELEWIKENAMENDSFFYEIKRLDILPNGTALICGTGHIFNDSTETIYQSSNILIKRKGAWKAVASHVSGIKNLD